MSHHRRRRSDAVSPLAVSGNRRDHLWRSRIARNLLRAVQVWLACSEEGFGDGDSSLPTERRQKIVEQLLGGKAHNVTVQLASMLVGTGHVALLPEVADALVKRASSEKQQEVAEVRSAVALNDAQKTRISEALAKATGKKLNLKVVVDPSVIGGIVATVGDEVIDDTVRTRLDQVKSRF
ncbi:MAG: ATP synthase F1 subunit delta [Actinobacteria bacterium]|nr:ATP synthase F1 subunit delta [Actinomycetota bacterium]